MKSEWDKIWDAHQQSSPEIHFYDERISINLYFPPASWEGGIPGKIPISYLRWISEPSGVSESVSINLHDTRKNTKESFCSWPTCDGWRRRAHLPGSCASGQLRADNVHMGSRCIESHQSNGPRKSGDRRRFRKEWPWGCGHSCCHRRVFYGSAN